MPTKPGAACPCGGTRHKGICNRCGAQRNASEALRPSSNERGYDMTWRRYSELYRLENPWCVECLKQGRTMRAEVVDHVIPHRGDRDLFWDTGNHQGLCKRHHDRKTASGA
jgi:5-methylcytosine-specific restriction protein A